MLENMVPLESCLNNNSDSTSLQSRLAPASSTFWVLQCVSIPVQVENKNKNQCKLLISCSVWDSPQASSLDPPGRNMCEGHGYSHVCIYTSGTGRDYSHMTDTYKESIVLN